MDFRLTERQKWLQERCQELAADFAIRSADQTATRPTDPKFSTRRAFPRAAARKNLEIQIDKDIVDYLPMKGDTLHVDGPFKEQQSNCV